MCWFGIGDKLNGLFDFQKTDNNMPNEAMNITHNQKINMSKRFFVLYSLTRRSEPKIFKTMQTVNRYLKANPELVYERFDSEEEAKTFAEKCQVGGVLDSKQGVKEILGGMKDEGNLTKESNDNIEAKQTMEKKEIEIKSVKNDELKNNNSNQSLNQSYLTSSSVSLDSISIEDANKTIFSNDSNQKIQDKIIENDNLSIKKDLQQKVLNLNGNMKGTQILRHFFSLNTPKTKFQKNKISKLHFSTFMRQNPGFCLVSYELSQGNETIFTNKHFIGQKSNIEAEFISLIYGLWDAYLHGIHNINVQISNQFLLRLVRKEICTIDPRLMKLQIFLRTFESQIQNIVYQKSQQNSMFSLKNLFRYSWPSGIYDYSIFNKTS